MSRVRICRLFGDCGGCAVFEPDYRIELEARLRRAAAALDEAGMHDLPTLGLLHEPLQHAPRHFRSRVLWMVQAGPRRSLLAGLYRPGSHEVVDIHRCETQDPDLTALARMTVDLAAELGLEAWDERRGGGFLRALDLRVMASTGEALLSLVTRGGLWDEGRDFARELRRRARELERDHGPRPFALKGVLRNLPDEAGTGSGNRVLGPSWLPLSGRAWQLDRPGRGREGRAAGSGRVRRQERGKGAEPLRFQVTAGSFYQSHKQAVRLLYGPVLDRIGALDGRRVVDAYGGVGCFALRLARAGAASVVLVESHPVAVRDARRNVALNGHEAVVEVREGRVAEVLAGIVPGPDLCLLDPPRAGLLPDGRRAVLALRPDRIVYVSCHAPSLARDLRVLVEGGYRVDDLAAADLFPRTDHLEVVASLSRLA